MNDNIQPASPAEVSARIAEAKAIKEFWQWWNTTGAAALDAMFTGKAEPLDLQAEVGGRLAAINPGLVWGFEADHVARHLITVTAAGDPRVRPTARRWLEAAPSDDDIWAFTDLRDPAPNLELLWEVPGADGTSQQQTVRVADALFDVHKGNSFLDVRVYHPLFEQLLPAGEVGQQSIVQLGFTLLQLALGEQDFGLWIRNLTFTEQKPANALNAMEMAELIDDLTAHCPAWLEISANSNGTPIRVNTRAPLNQLIEPLFTEHVVVQVLYNDIDSEGLPGATSQEALAALHQQFQDALAGTGALVATESSDGICLFHFYVDSVAFTEAGDVADTTPLQRLSQVAHTWEQGQVEIDHAYDPAWDRVGHLRI